MQPTKILFITCDNRKSKKCGWNTVPYKDSSSLCITPKWGTGFLANTASLWQGPFNLSTQQMGPFPEHHSFIKKEQTDRHYNIVAET